MAIDALIGMNLEIGRMYLFLLFQDAEMKGYLIADNGPLPHNTRERFESNLINNGMNKKDYLEIFSGFVEIEPSNSGKKAKLEFYSIYPRNNQVLFYELLRGIFKESE